MIVKKGFSLIELTVVISLLALLMLAISSTMLMSIISSKRIRTATKTKQAGNYAIGQIQSILRNAKSIKICNSSSNTITTINPGGGETQILLSNSRVASNSGTYLTPDNTTTSLFSLSCNPSDTDPSIVKVSFDLRDALAPSGIQNPSLHFETSVNLRNK